MDLPATPEHTVAFSGKSRYNKKDVYKRQTLKANGLEPIETVADVSARLIINTASMKLYKGQINDLIAKCETGLEKEL